MKGYFIERVCVGEMKKGVSVVTGLVVEKGKGSFPKFPRRSAILSYPFSNICIFLCLSIIVEDFFFPTE